MKPLLASSILSANFAHRLEERDEIEIEVIDIPESEILIEAIRRNSRHGKQLSWVEKRHYAVLLYRERDMDVTQIAEVLSVSEQWIRDLLLEPITETDL